MRNNKYTHIWKHTKNGEYSVKSGYWQIIQGESFGETSNSSRENSAIWKKIWKVQTIPRCKELAWRACKNILPIRTQLRSRGLEIDGRCPMCGEDEETAQRALLTCRMVIPVWFASSLTIRIVPHNIISFSDWLSKLLEGSSSSGGAMIFELVYAICKVRNEWCFNGKRTSVLQMLDKAAGYMPPPPIQIPQHMEERNDHDQRGVPCFITHVDASISPGCGIGVGGVGVIKIPTKGKLTALFAQAQTHCTNICPEKGLKKEANVVKVQETPKKSINRGGMYDVQLEGRWS
ncbi:hypothetical protein RIF29_37885 [Crotalaria pallida]|uniref:Reverse transcriptase zinc-binding domain-containing protein n=1 Tax=Crotalaria pallida TaxID=3830 RepID=A0AAN9E3P7_CROPI